MNKPDLSYENTFEGAVAGIDEAGRGPWAGPVVAAAVILPNGNIPDGLNDSKKLSKKRRAELFITIQQTCLVGIGIATVEEIDEINILQASLLAMRRAVAELSQQPDANLAACLVDGNKDPNLNLPTECIVKGDGKSLSIAAASIIAKVFRDKIMADLSQVYPHYDWQQNSGYGVPKHIEALKLVGISPHHRKSFAPIRKIIDEETHTSR
ncbi:MAG: ribonuclease HII [Sphingomonadales bacterium]|nr:ribonuclease HII [Sphingomonadales bacterium]